MFSFSKLTMPEIERDPRNERAANLIKGYVNDRLTPAERRELREWVYEEGVNQFLFVVFTRDYHAGRPWKPLLDDVDRQPKPTFLQSWWMIIVGVILMVLVIVTTCTHAPVPAEFGRVKFRHMPGYQPK